MPENKHKRKRDAVRFAFGVLAIALAALACRQGQPANDPKPEPNSPLPKVDKPDNDGNGGPTVPNVLKKDGG